MSMTDPIADMLTRIRNALMVSKNQVAVPASSFKKSILDILVSEGYIASYAEREIRPHIHEIVVDLKYHEGRPAVKELSKVSKPGRRVFVEHRHLPRVKSGLGVAVISTSKGVMTDAQARQAGLGGEVICHVY